MTGGQDGGGTGRRRRHRSAAARPADAPLYERHAETAAAEQAVDRLCSGSAAGAEPLGGMLLYSGSAGLGKTALLARIRRTAGARGCTVLFARGSELDHTVPFHVVRQLLQPPLAALAGAERRELFGGWYDVAGPAVGLLAPAGGAPPDPQGVRDGLDQVVTRLAARRGPLLLALDDTHWADPESLAWLEPFAARWSELPILAVIAYRPDALPQEGAPFRDLIAHPSTGVMRLQELSPAAVADLAHEVLGPEADEAFCRGCWAVTGGNQYETVELLAKVADRGLDPTGQSTALLSALATAARGSGLVARLNRLSPSAVRYAWAAAVLGTDIPPDLAACVAGLDPDAAQDALGSLQAARLLTRTDPVEFVHPLIATAVYQAIPQATRTAMHGQAAWALIQAGRGMAAASRHLLETHPDSDLETVVQLRAAAREHLAVGAPDAARRCLERALAEPPPEELRADVLYELGCAALLNAPATTVSRLRAALALPGIRPGLREDATFRLAQALAHLDRLGDAADAVRAEARRATRPTARKRLEAAYFLWSAFRAEEPLGPARSRRLARLTAGLSGDDQGDRCLLALRAWDAVWRAEPAAEVVALAERAVGPGLDWADTEWGFEIPSVIAMCFYFTDRLHRAEAMLTDAVAAYERAGWSGAHLSFGHTLLGLVRFRRGRLAEAEDLAREGLRLARRVGRGVPAQWYATGLLTEVLVARGRVGEALAMAEEYAAGPPFPAAVTVPDAQYAHGALLLAAGRRREARAELAAVGDRLEPRGRRNPAWCPWAGHLALALADEDPGQARRLAEQAVRRARHFGTASAEGSALRIAAAVGDRSAALGLLERAVLRLGESPCGYELALALVDHGAALRLAGRTGEAAQQLQHGIELALECGADGLAERARSELAAAGRQSSLLRLPGRDKLDHAERRIAEFAAGGLSVAAIAERLCSPATEIARRLSAACRKLGTDVPGLAAALCLPPGQPERS